MTCSSAATSTAGFAGAAGGPSFFAAHPASRMAAVMAAAKARGFMEPPGVVCGREYTRAPQPHNHKRPGLPGGLQFADLPRLLRGAARAASPAVPVVEGEEGEPAGREL